MPGNVQGQTGWGPEFNIIYWKMSLAMLEGWNQMVLKVLSNSNHSTTLYT